MLIVHAAKHVAIGLFAMAVTGGAALAQSGVISGTHAGCLTERDLGELSEAIYRDDVRQIQALLDQGRCVGIEGREYSVVERGLRRSQVRIYAGGDSVVLWARTDAIR